MAVRMDPRIVPPIAAPMTAPEERTINERRILLAFMTKAQNLLEKKLND